MFTLLPFESFIVQNYFFFLFFIDRCDSPCLWVDLRGFLQRRGDDDHPPDPDGKDGSRAEGLSLRQVPPPRHRPRIPGEAGGRRGHHRHPGGPTGKKSLLQRLSFWSFFSSQTGKNPWLYLTLKRLIFGGLLQFKNARFEKSRFLLKNIHECFVWRISLSI